MPRLTAIEIKSAVPAEKGKRRKMYDDRGLILVINDGGAKWWQYRYCVGGKRKFAGLAHTLQ